MDDEKKAQDAEVARLMRVTQSVLWKWPGRGERGYVAGNMAVNLRARMSMSPDDVARFLDLCDARNLHPVRTIERLMREWDGAFADGDVLDETEGGEQ